MRGKVVATGSLRGWVSSSVPIGLWIVHLSALAALAQPTCEDPGLSWVPHALTVGLGLACVPFLVMSVRLISSPVGDESEGPGDLRFLGWLGLAMSAFSLVLILAEGLVVFLVGPCL